MRTLIKDIEIDKEIEIRGFVDKFRDLKFVQFIIVSDVSGSIQVTIDKELNKDLIVDSALTTGSTVIVKGKAVSSPSVKLGGVEFIPTEVIIETLAEVSPISTDSSSDLLLDYRWIDLRQPHKRLVFQVQTTLIDAMRRFVLNKDFIEIHTPKLSAISSEGGSEVFKTDYFGQEVFLTQSPQLYKQMAIASGFDKVFEIGEAFRAEKSYTNKHVTEFVSFDIEMGNIDSHEDVMKLEEEMIAYAIGEVKEKYGDKIKETFGFDLVVPTVPFPRFKMEEVYKILNENGFEIEDGEDISTDMEKFLGDYMVKKNGHDFFFITDYPAEIRAFYHMNYEGTNIAKGYDLYYKQVEITTGAQREHRVEKLKAKMLERGIQPEHLQQYVDFFRYGCPAHGGFAIGVERITMLLLNQASLRDTALIYRSPNRIKP